MNQKNLIFPFIASALLAIAVPTNANFLLVTLGGLTPGETTTEEVTKELQQKNCQFYNKDGSIDIKPGCFLLPGNPEITLGPGFDGKAGVIGEVSFTFPNDHNQNFQSYYDKLRDKYGKPAYDKQDLEQWVATWRLPDQYYILAAEFNKGTGMLIVGDEATFRHELQTQFPAAYQVIDLDEI